jgi:hypothetical protein
VTATLATHWILVHLAPCMLQSFLIPRLMQQLRPSCLSTNSSKTSGERGVDLGREGAYGDAVNIHRHYGPHYITRTRVKNSRRY